MKQFRETIRTIAFDADDTLWHNENLFTMTQSKFKELLSPHCSSELIDSQLLETEMRNLSYYGYGIKGFTLSMIETAIELTNGRISGSEIREIIRFARDMLRAPIQLLDHVEDVLIKLSQSYKLMLITKGDLFEQETKVARSGLAGYFEHIEIVSEKSADTYRLLLGKHDIQPERFLMVGNSVKSDVLPVLAIEGKAIHIPYYTTWAHEVTDGSEKQNKKILRLKQISLLPGFIDNLSSSDQTDGSLSGKDTE